MIHERMTKLQEFASDIENALPLQFPLKSHVFLKWSGSMWPGSNEDDVFYLSSNFAFTPRLCKLVIEGKAPLMKPDCAIYKRYIDLLSRFDSWCREECSFYLNRFDVVLWAHSNSEMTCQNFDIHLYAYYLHLRSLGVVGIPLLKNQCHVMLSAH